VYIYDNVLFKRMTSRSESYVAYSRTASYSTQRSQCAAMATLEILLIVKVCILIVDKFLKSDLHIY